MVEYKTFEDLVAEIRLKIAEENCACDILTANVYSELVYNIGKQGFEEGSLDTRFCIYSKCKMASCHMAYIYLQTGWSLVI